MVAKHADVSVRGAGEGGAEVQAPDAELAGVWAAEKMSQRSRSVAWHTPSVFAKRGNCRAAGTLSEWAESGHALHRVVAMAEIGTALQEMLTSSEPLARTIG